VRGCNSIDIYPSILVVLFTHLPSSLSCPAFSSLGALAIAAACGGRPRRCIPILRLPDRSSKPPLYSLLTVPSSLPLTVLLLFCFNTFRQFKIFLQTQFHHRFRSDKPSAGEIRFGCFLAFHSSPATADSKQASLHIHHWAPPKHSQPDNCRQRLLLQYHYSYHGTAAANKPQKIVTPTI
jgi:hypothetical protein